MEAASFAIGRMWGGEEWRSWPEATLLELDLFLDRCIGHGQLSSSTLELALCYLHKVRHEILPKIQASRVARWEINSGACSTYPVQDHQALVLKLAHPFASGKKTFLAMMICAMKVNQDDPFTNELWAEITGLSVEDINLNERVLLAALGDNSYVHPDALQDWAYRLRAFAEKHQKSRLAAHGIVELCHWRGIAAP